MADRAFFQDVFAGNGSLDARNYHLHGNSHRIFKRRRDCLFFADGFARFDILRLSPRRGLNHRAFFRTARRQRLPGRGGSNPVFYPAAYFDVSDKSIFEDAVEN